MQNTMSITKEVLSTSSSAPIKAREALEIEKTLKLKGLVLES